MQERPTTSSPKGVARRRLIVDTATRLIARNGSRGTSLAQIARESGVSQPGLIYYFPTKEALIQAVVDHRSHTLISDRSSGRSRGAWRTGSAAWWRATDGVA